MSRGQGALKSEETGISLNQRSDLGSISSGGESQPLKCREQNESPSEMGGASAGRKVAASPVFSSKGIKKIKRRREFSTQGEKVGALTSQAGCGMGLLPWEALTERLGNQAPPAGSN